VLRERLAEVEERIQGAVRLAGRRRDEITLVAVTKVFPAQTILEAYELGIRQFGENYVQEFESKLPQLEGLDQAEFHLIGHLQSNKAKRASEIFNVIQTVDTHKLARRLAETGREIPVMVEVKLSEEGSKTGVDPAGLAALIDGVRGYPNLQLTGLMTMPPWSDDPEQSRPYFRRLRELAEWFTVPNLSMGMSHDFEAAIEEGATHIRIGTALFGSRKER